MHYAWLDREYDAQSWSEELKEKFRKLLIIKDCFHCNRHYKEEIGYYRTPTGSSVIQPDLSADSLYCYFCALQFDNIVAGNENVLVFFIFNSINNESTH